MRRLAITLIFILIAAATGRGYELMTSKGIGLGHTLQLAEPSASSLVNLPASSLKPGGWQIEGGYNRRFELSDLDQLFLVGALRVRQFTLTMGVSQFGKTDLYAEQTIKGGVAWHYRKLTVGPSLSGMQVQIGDGYGTLRAATFGGGMSLAWPRWSLGLSADNLTRPSLIENARPSEPLYALYAEFLGKGAYTVNGRIAWEKYQDPRYGLGQTIKLSERGTIFWGLAFNPLEFGGGIQVGIAGGTISYATSVHPVLGFSHTVSFSYGSQARSRTKKQDEF